MEYHEAGEKDSKANLICNTVDEATVLVFIYADPVEKQPAVFNAFDKIACVARIVPPKVYNIFEIFTIFESTTACEPKTYIPRVALSIRRLIGLEQS